MSPHIGRRVRTIVSIGLIMAVAPPSMVEHVSASLKYPQRKMAGNNRPRGADGSTHMRPDPEAAVAL